MRKTRVQSLEIAKTDPAFLLAMESMPQGSITPKKKNTTVSRSEHKTHIKSYEIQYKFYKKR
jgi:hypothetical protein